MNPNSPTYISGDNRSIPPSTQVYTLYRHTHTHTHIYIHIHIHTAWIQNWADVLTPQTLVLPGPPAGPSKHPVAHLACIEIALVACGSCRFPLLFPQVSHQHVQLSAAKIIQIPPPAFASYFFPHVFFLHHPTSSPFTWNDTKAP